ncbi:MAG: hypothetical protein R6W66_03960 [Pelovirga sp.]
MITLKKMMTVMMILLVAGMALGCAAADLQADNSATAAATSYDRPGFVTGVTDGRLWVFRAGSAEADAYLADGKTPAKHVVRPGAGPDGMTLRSPDSAILDDYRLAKEGFVTGVKEGRLWVFRAGSAEGDAYLADGKTPAKHVVRPGAGPDGMTIRAPEAADIDAYLSAR